jgi:hypothetical protein
MRLTQGVAPIIDSSLSLYERELRLELIRSAKDRTLSRPVAESTRYLVEELFGYSISQQYSLENYFRGLQQISPIMHPDVYDRVTVDQFDYDLNYVRSDLGDHFFCDRMM